MLKVMTLAVVFVLAVFAGGCAAPPPNEPQCQDVTTMSETLRTVPFQSNEIAEEANGDVAEMGAHNNCVGYSKAQADKD